DERPVVPDRNAKSFGSEQTFEEDLTDPEQVLGVLFSQADQTAWRLRRQNRLARSITLKIRFGDFQTITRSTTLPSPTDRTDLIWETAKSLFGKWAEHHFSPVRLIGMAATALEGNQAQLDLFDQAEDHKRREVDSTADRIRQRFGSDAIRRGRSLDS
ncbi:MAG: hypothetical protein R3236_07125, partial [Phycisphaeraceae bacterium]|nr:hypothetical protein [Phycisphaeraceae bacterium]